MKVPRDLLERKTLIIALLDCAAELARELGLDTAMPVAAMSRSLGANRTAVYQQQRRLLGALAALANARPGRPPKSSAGPGGSGEDMALTIRVLDFRLQHPDAVVEHTGRTSYSPTFRRFILGEFDAWPGAVASFAEASRVPVDTLKDWRQDDQAGLQSARRKEREASVPVDACEAVRKITEDFAGWEGTTKDFLRVTAKKHGFTTNQVARVLRICGAIPARVRRGHRHRGTTQRLCPGALPMTDGKMLDVELTGSGTRTRQNWQGMVDQATGCDVAVVVTVEEDAAAVSRTTPGTSQLCLTRGEQASLTDQPIPQRQPPRPTTTAPICGTTQDAPRSRVPRGVSNSTGGSS